VALYAGLAMLFCNQAGSHTGEGPGPLQQAAAVPPDLHIPVPLDNLNSATEEVLVIDCHGHGYIFRPPPAPAV